MDENHTETTGTSKANHGTDDTSFAASDTYSIASTVTMDSLNNSDRSSETFETAPAASLSSDSLSTLVPENENSSISSETFRTAASSVKSDISNVTDHLSQNHVQVIQAESEAEEALPASGDDSGASDLESDIEDHNLVVEPIPEQLLVPMQLKWQNRNPNPQLPETATVLKASNGGKVYLVGTVHFSKESQEDVAATIQATQPDIVMVELCQSRVNILSLDEKMILEESKNMNLDKMRQAIKQNGLVQGIMYLLLLSMSAHLTKQLGMAPGGEFRRACIEGRRVPGCLIHLGDRPIQITLQRALAALSFWQKIRLAWYIFTSKDPITKEEVERFKKSDLLEELLAEMTGEFPAVSRVFVKERDLYLAYSLKLAATPIQSPAGTIPAVVVGVVGIGHVPGIVEHWGKVTEEDIAEILKVPPPSLGSVIFRRTLKTAMLGLTIWGVYKVLPSSVTNVLSPKRPINWVVGLFAK